MKYKYIHTESVTKHAASLSSVTTYSQILLKEKKKKKRYYIDHQSAENIIRNKYVIVTISLSIDYNLGGLSKPRT